MTLDEIIKDYCEWLDIKGPSLRKGSQKSYGTYIKTLLSVFVCKLYNDEELEFDKNGESNGTMCHLLNYIEHNVDKEKQIKREKQNKSIWKRSDKYLRNCSSSISSFRQYVEDENVSIVNKLPKIIFGFKSYDRTYSNKELMKILYNRLITQDRKYEHIMYPARLINQIFNNCGDDCLCKRYRKLLIGCINKCKFHVDENGKNPVEFQYIKSIEIKKSGDIKINGCHDLYTPTSGSGFEKQKASSISDLSLDHKIPLVDILNNNENYKEYPTLVKLSNVIAKENGLSNCTDFKKIKGSASKWTKDAKEKSLNEIHAEKLITDLEKLYYKIELVQMDKSKNSSKNDGRNFED